MSTSAFQYVPLRKFRARALLALSPLLLLGALLVGMLGFSLSNSMPSAARVEVSAWNPFAFYSAYGHEWRERPEGCVTGEIQSEFQRGRCAQFWSEFLVTSAIAGLPAVFWWIGYLLAMDSLKLTYRRVRKHVARQKPLMPGVVAEDGPMERDYYAWFYGFRARWIDVGGRREISVYFPPDGYLPQPGEPITVFSLGKVLGRPRYFGTANSPHVAVLSSMTRD